MIRDFSGPAFFWNERVAAVLGERFVVEGPFREGGHGQILVAQDRILQRRVVLKINRESSLELADRLQARFSHPNIVPLLDILESPELCVLVLGWVEGETLLERIRRDGPLLPDVASKMMMQLASALAHLHKQRVAHGDLSPPNVVVDSSNHLWLLDFGLARETRSGEGARGQPSGTPGFASPEQLAGRLPDERSDIYALGALLHFCLTGTTSTASAPSAPLSRVELLPAYFAPVVTRMLSMLPARRPDLPEVMEVLGGKGPAGLDLRLQRWLSRGRSLTALFLLWTWFCLAWATWSMLDFLDLTDGLGLRIAYIILTAPLFYGSLALATLPWFSRAFWRVIEGCRLLTSGYTLGDLRHALARDTDSPPDGRAIAKSPSTRAIEKGRKWVGWACGLAVAAGLGAAVIEPAILHRFGAPFRVAGMLSFGGLVFVVEWSRQRPGVLDLQRRLWGGRIGGWLARRFQREAEHSHEHWRPGSESLEWLRDSIEQLVASLPQAYRRELDDMPVVLDALVQYGKTLRARLVGVQRTVHPHGSEDPDSLNSELSHDRSLESALRGKLSSVESAMAGLRASLLRLHSGSLDAESIKTLSDEVQSLEDTISRLNEASSQTKLP